MREAILGEEYDVEITKTVRTCDRCGADETTDWAKPIEAVTIHRKSVNGGRAVDLCKFCLSDLHALVEEKIRRVNLP